jgi:hypothetical protein
LAAIAELLACKAGSENNLRIGPASNNAWKPAFDILEVRNLKSLVHFFFSISELS